MPEKRIDAVDEQIAHRMLHVLGLIVHFVPAHVERPQQEKFDEPVTADHAERQHAAGPRERHPLVGPVRCQPGGVERLEHARDCAGRHVERRRQLAGGGGAALLPRHDLIDRLHVVFDRQAWHASSWTFW